MDNFDDTFFSPEALRLLQAKEDHLDAQALDLVSSWETPNPCPPCSMHGTAAAAREGQQRVPRSQKRAGQGYSTFPATNDQGPRHKRSKFGNPERRAEVAKVRKEGACLSCRWNKSSVR